MKRGFGWRTERLAFAAAAFLAGCGYPAPMPIPPAGFTQAELANKDRGFISFAVQLSNWTQRLNCQTVHASLTRLGRAAGIAQVEQVRGPFDYRLKMGLLARELPPGNYGISNIACNNSAPVGEASLSIGAGDMGHFASFAVEKGEVVNLGMLTLDIIELPRDVSFISRNSKPNPISTLVLTDPMPPELVQMTRADIREKQQFRPMIPSMLVDPGMVASRCAEQTAIRNKKVIISLGGGGPPPVCGRLSGGVVTTSVAKPVQQSEQRKQ